MIRTVQLGLLSAGNIGLTVLFQWYALVALGPGRLTDALFAGMTVPQIVLAVVSSSLTHVLVPLLAGEREDTLRRDAWSLLFAAGAALTLLAILLWVAAPWWVPLTVPGFDERGLTLTIDIARIHLISMVFAAVNGVQVAACHARQKFLWAEFAPFLAGLPALLLLSWALPRFGVTVAAWTGVLRIVVQTVLLAPAMGAVSPPDLQRVAIRKAWQRIKPLVLGASYYKTDPLVDRILLSGASSGSLSLYYLAQQLYGGVTQVISKALVSPLIPDLSTFHKKGDLSGFVRAYRMKMLEATVIAIAGLSLLVVGGKALLTFFVGHGQIDDGSVEILWWLMICLGGVLVGGVAGQIASGAFYACGDTATPTRISILTYTAYIPVKVAAFHFSGVSGLAITTSVYYCLNLLLQIFCLERRLLHE